MRVFFIFLIHLHLFTAHARPRQCGGGGRRKEDTNSDHLFYSWRCQAVRFIFCSVGPVGRLTDEWIIRNCMSRNEIDDLSFLTVNVSVAVQARATTACNILCNRKWICSVVGCLVGSRLFFAINSEFRTTALHWFSGTPIKHLFAGESIANRQRRLYTTHRWMTNKVNKRNATSLIQPKKNY